MLIPRRTPSEQALLAGAALAIYGAGWAPLLGQWLVNEHLSPLIVGGVGLAAGGGAWWLRRRVPRLHLALAVPYWFILLGVHVAFGFMARWLSPLYFWLAVGLGLAALLPVWRRDKWPAVVLSAAAIAGALFCAADLRHNSNLAAAGALGVLLPVGAGLFYLSRRKRLTLFSRPAMAVCAFAIMIYPAGFVHYSFVFPKLLPRIEAQPGVHAVYDYHRGRLPADFCTQVMYLAKAPGRELFAAGPQNPCRRLNIFAAGEPIASLDLESRSTDNLVFDPDDPATAYIGTIAELLHVSLDPPRVLRRLPLHATARNLNFIHYDPAGDRLFVSQDYGPNVYVVDRQSFRAVARLTEPGKVTDDVWLDPVGNLVWVGGTYAFGWRVDTYDLTTLARRQTYRWPGDIGFHFGTVDPAGRRAYLASTSSGLLRVLDLDTLKPIGQTKLEAGLRNVNFDPARRLVLIGSYFRGNLFVYSPERDEVVATVFLGPRLRWVQVDAETGRWYATSSAGGFEIDPEQIVSRLR